MISDFTVFLYILSSSDRWLLPGSPFPYLPPLRSALAGLPCFRLLPDARMIATAMLVIISQPISLSPVEILLCLSMIFPHCRKAMK